MTDLVSRAAELAALVGAVGRGGPEAVNVVGSPGMGKTTLVNALLAAVDGPLVLRARPLESESSLAFSGLTAILAGLPESTFAELPAPQASSLRAALLLEDVTGDVDPRAVAAGLRGVLVNLAARRPVLLVVDDAQWLDPSSAHALSQALHRIGTARLVLVCASRPGGDAMAWLPASGFDPVAEVRLGPLSADDLMRVVQSNLGTIVELGDLRGIERASGGNPLHALELARHRLDSGTGGTVEELVRERLTVLPRETRIALLTSALASHPHLEVVARARGCSQLELVAVLDPAVRAGLVRVTDLVLFAHPLYAEAAISAGSAPDRSEAHRRLADAEPSEEARVRHAGLGVDGPDARLAASLATTAARTRARGAWDAAVELLTLAVTRTPVESPDRGDRALLLGRWAFQSGQPSLAEGWFVDVREHHPGSSSYWSATMGLARLCLHAARTAEMHALNRELLAADLDPLLAAEAMVRTVNDEFADRPSERIERIAAANRVLSAAGAGVDPALLVAGLSLEIQARMTAGQATDELMARAVALDAQHPADVALDAPSLELAHLLMMADRFDEGRAVCLSMLTRCRAMGDDVSLPTVYSHLAHLEQRAGQWDAARAAIVEGERWARGHGPIVTWQLRAQSALLDGLQGSHDEALSTLRQASELFAGPEYYQFGAIISHLRGRVHAAYSEQEQAYAAFATAIELAAQVGWDDPANLESDVPFAEAASALGRFAEAERHLDRTEQRARQLGQTNQLAVCRRGRIGLLAARGDLDEAALLVPEMLAAYDSEPGQPLDRALALLVAGRLLRRTRQKRQAHDCLTAGLDIFGELGCPAYVEVARSELNRVGLRPSRPEALTPTELEVARLAADGLRNVEIATTAHLSVKTVEAVLSRVYRKLGIRSRAQLSRALASLPERAAASSPSGPAAPPT
ncbi:AAA family ATPase [Longivirga aurantiaca]|uniref:AAA family ATPase n=1 Tax=Longivirga aurantiaca TaxID=1837743 RepID=A0ABW1T215_9ACTN